jgi:hypothetical protein
MVGIAGVIAATIAGMMVAMIATAVGGVRENALRAAAAR